MKTKCRILKNFLPVVIKEIREYTIGQKVSFSLRFRVLGGGVGRQTTQTKTLKLLEFIGLGANAVKSLRQLKPVNMLPYIPHRFVM